MILQQLGARVNTIKIAKPIQERNTPVSVPTMVENQNIAGVHVFLDGSAIGNGKSSVKAGYAAVFVHHPELTLAEHLGYMNGQAPTNNRAEYMALIRALEVAPVGVPVKAFTDSMLLLKTVTEWIAVWKRKGWKKADGTAVLNLDLVKRLDALRSQRQLTMQHVKAHTGKNDYHSIWNDKADQMAKAAALMVPS